jgi:hypothetical protein
MRLKSIKGILTLFGYYRALYSQRERKTPTMKTTKKDDGMDVYLEAVRKRRKLNNTNRSSVKKRQRDLPLIDANSPRGRFVEFMQQDVHPSGFELIPEGYRGITYFMLFLFVPKLIGMGFFFFYMAEGDIELYRQVHTGGALLDWVIGYEIVAAVVLLYIAKQLLGFMFAK